PQRGTPDAAAFGSLRLRQARAGSRVAGTVVLRSVRGARRGDLRAGAEAFEDVIAQAPDCRLVQSVALRLPVRPAHARVPSGARVGSLVPGDPEPGELFELPLREGGAYAGAVEVLDAHREAASRGARPQPRQDGGTCVAQVQLAGRARGESSPLGYRHARPPVNPASVLRIESLETLERGIMATSFIAGAR